MKPGDIIDCIDVGAAPALTLGKSYRVEHLTEGQYPISDSLFVVNDLGQLARYYTKRFRMSAQNFIKVEDSTVTFKLQDGPIKEVGVNGCQIDDVVAFARDKIAAFQAAIPCPENGHALVKLEEALMWLDQRKKNREKRNVEGTSKT